MYGTGLTTKDEILETTIRNLLTYQFGPAVCPAIANIKISDLLEMC